jgi:hypothetical protein
VSPTPKQATEPPDEIEQAPTRIRELNERVLAQGARVGPRLPRRLRADAALVRRRSDQAADAAGVDWVADLLCARDFLRKVTDSNTATARHRAQRAVDKSLSRDPRRDWEWGASIGMGPPLEDCAAKGRRAPANNRQIQRCGLGTPEETAWVSSPPTSPATSRPRTVSSATRTWGTRAPPRFGYLRRPRAASTYVTVARRSRSAWAVMRVAAPGMRLSSAARIW